MRLSITFLGVGLVALVAVACGGGGDSGSSPTMDHGETMDHGDMNAGEFDAMFIDGMIVHHEGAIAMANEALDEAERPEILALAQAIVDAQGEEIQQLQTWRDAWYPDAASTGGMMDMDMGPMEVDDDPAVPYEQRFIDAMIPHHEGAIAMANEALKSATHPEIRTMAEEVIRVQQEEIGQMREWRREWYGN